MTSEEIFYLGTTDVWKALMAVYKRRHEPRKWRFFAVACCRRVWHLVPPASRPLVEVVERLLAGTARDAERAAQYANRPDLLRAASIEKAAWHTASPGNSMRSVGPREIPYNVLEAVGEAAMQAVSADLADATRDIFGNPFRPEPVLDPSWLTWDDGTVRKLAQGVYDDRAFDRLPILADALEEAGCTAADLLAHLRGPRPHVPGCWAVDLLLGKG
jgi:hypothetical protein